MDEINSVQVQRFLGGVSYPASKDTLVETARQNGAPEDVIDAIDSLSGDEEFQTPSDVTEALSR